jgi:catechol 2,3-dioxygenase-like lactoylglutathione lyase family enzyme
MTYSKDTRSIEPSSDGEHEVVHDTRGLPHARRQPRPQRRSPSLAKGMQVVTVSVPVSDQDQAKEFYVDTLGFELLVDNSWREGMRWIEVAPESSAASLMLVSWQDSLLSSMYRVIVVATDDILAFHEDLVAKGVFFELPPTESLNGTQAMFRDPDGNAIVLWERSSFASRERTSWFGRRET